MKSILVLLLMLCPVTALSADGDERLDIHWIDVEGGAATLVVTPAGESILFDSGYARFAGRIDQHLKNVAKLTQLDFLVTTHYDGDHYEGAVPLSRMIPVVHLVDNGRFDGMRRDPGRDYFTLPAESKIVIDPGDSIPLRQVDGAPPLSLVCLATRQEFIQPPQESTENSKQNDAICADARTQEPDTSENANSTVFLLQYGEFRFFNAADLTWNLEAKLVCPVDLVGKVDVYQVTHHGLDRSNNPLVIRTLQPTISVMNNGPKKGTQPLTFQTLKNTPSIKTMYQLHENVRPDGVTNNTEGPYIANRAGVTGNYLHLSVDPSGSRYTVTNPSAGHEQTYPTSAK